MLEEYSYWILAEDTIQQELQALVDELAKSHSGPAFRPHMTLLGSFMAEKADVLSKSDAVADKVRGMMLSFGPVEFSTTYFQNVFVRVHTTARLMDGFIFARDLFAVDPGKVFMPHMSLLYGDHSMQEREEIASKISLSKEPFKAALLVVTPSTPNPADWISLREIKL